jgi:hypothetical protein
MIAQMTSQLGEAALVGFALSAFAWLWTRLSRSAEDRAALWAIGLAAVLVGSTATLFVRPLHVALELPRALGSAKHRTSSAAAEMDFGLRGVVPSAVKRGALPASGWPSAMVSRAKLLTSIKEAAVDLWAIVTAVLLARWLLGYLRAFRSSTRGCAPASRLFLSGSVRRCPPSARVARSRFR